MIRTATGKEKALADFYAQLSRDAAARPGVYAGTVTELARQARVGRCHLARILSARSVGRQTGRQTWKHVLPHLSEAALCALKQCSAWSIHAEAALAEHLSQAANVVEPNGGADVRPPAEFAGVLARIPAGGADSD